MSHTILLYHYRKRTTGPFQTYKYHFCGIIIMKETAKRIIEEYHNGEIKVEESTIGQGTKMMIKLKGIE